MDKNNLIILGIVTFGFFFLFQYMQQQQAMTQQELANLQSKNGGGIITGLLSVLGL